MVCTARVKTTTIIFSFIQTTLKVLFFNNKRHQNETFGYKWKIYYVSLPNHTAIHFEKQYF